jgi:hypothetical protein
MKVHKPRFLIAHLMVIVAIMALGFAAMPFLMATAFAIMVLIAGSYIAVCGRITVVELMSIVFIIWVALAVLFPPHAWWVK